MGESLTLQIIRIIGRTWVGESSPLRVKPEELERLFFFAHECRVGLLLLSRFNDYELTPNLRIIKRELVEREQRTMKVLTSVSQVLKAAGVKHVIVKSIRPFPFLANDTDVLVLGTSQNYCKALRALRDSGYGILGQAPLQTLLFDPAGEGRVDIKKSGGTYYIDLYRAAGADYFIYLSGVEAEKAINNARILGEEVPILTPTLDLTMMLFHNVFPENTFHLEHFYLILYRLCGQDAIEPSDLVKRAIRHRYLPALRANITVAKAFHEAVFGTTPEEILETLELLGGIDGREWQRVIEGSFQAPHYFSVYTFLSVFIERAVVPVSALSLVRQGFNMLRPKFGTTAMKSFFKRVKGVGVYEQQ